jgi:hypothetical protein
MEWLAVGLGILYIALLVTLGVMTFRGGHIVMFVLGFFFPVLWLIGALIAPTEAASRPRPVASSP